MEKSCENCDLFIDKVNDEILCECQCDCKNQKHFRVSRKILESQLDAANALIIEQIEQIAKERTELEQYKEALRLADKQLSEVYGTCPTDLGFLTEDPNWCAEHCKDKIEGCWSRYLLFKVKGGQT